MTSTSVVSEEYRAEQLFFNNVVVHVIENSKWLPGGHLVFPDHYEFHLGPS